MIFDKLWVRIKGEVAGWREERDPGSGNLLDAIERRLFPDSRQGRSGQDDAQHIPLQETQPADPKPRQAAGQTVSETTHTPTEPNPRRLG